MTARPAGPCLAAIALTFLTPVDPLLGGLESRVIACFQRKGIVFVRKEPLVKYRSHLARRLVAPQLMGSSVRRRPLNRHGLCYRP